MCWMKTQRFKPMSWSLTFCTFLVWTWSQCHKYFFVKFALGVNPTNCLFFVERTFFPFFDWNTMRSLNDELSQGWPNFLDGGPNSKKKWCCGPQTNYQTKFSIVFFCLSQKRLILYVHLQNYVRKLVALIKFATRAACGPWALHSPCLSYTGRHHYSRT